jgi:hypothetical protein
MNGPSNINSSCCASAQVIRGFERMTRASPLNVHDDIRFWFKSDRALVRFINFNHGCAFRTHGRASNMLPMRLSKAISISEIAHAGNSFPTLAQLTSAGGVLGTLLLVSWVCHQSAWYQVLIKPRTSHDEQTEGVVRTLGAEWMAYTASTTELGV